MDIFNVYSSVFSAFPIINEFMVFMVMILGGIFTGGFCLVWGVLFQPEIQQSNENIEANNYSWAWARNEEWEQTVVIPGRWDNMESSVLTAFTRESFDLVQGPDLTQTIAFINVAYVPYPWKHTVIDEMLM